MLHSSARQRATRQISALRRLATSPNPPEAEQARKRAVEMQSRYRITEKEIDLSDADARSAITVTGWDDMWQLALLGSLGGMVGLGVGYEISNDISTQGGPDRIRLVGFGAGRVLREAEMLRDHVAKYLERRTPRGIRALPIAKIFQTGPLVFQYTATMEQHFGDDAVEIYAMILVYRGIERVGRRLRREMDVQLEVEKAVEQPGPPPTATPRPAAPEPEPDPAPVQEASAWEIRYNRVCMLATQLTASQTFIEEAQADPAVWDACAGRLDGDGEAHALLIDRQHVTKTDIQALAGSG